jgi:hypothetical protein
MVQEYEICLVHPKLMATEQPLHHQSTLADSMLRTLFKHVEVSVKAKESNHPLSKLHIGRRNART